MRAPDRVSYNFKVESFDRTDAMNRRLLTAHPRPMETWAAILYWLISTVLLPQAVFGQGSACVLITPEDGGEDRLFPATSDAWIWQARPGDSARCDVEGYEPLDAGCPEASCPGGERRLHLVPARTVEIAGPRPDGLVNVEWRRFGAPGDASERLAHRQLMPPTAPQPWLLYSASEEGRLMRLRRPQGAPETFFVPAVSQEGPETETEPRPLHPRWPAAGGEIFGIVEAEDFQPTALLLNGGGAMKELKPGDWGQFAASGLHPEQFRLHAVFRGGWRFDGPLVVVEEGETTELLPWTLPRSGAVELDIEPGLCAEITGGASLVFDSDLSGDTRRLEIEDETCTHRFEGLPPGEWNISVDRHGPPSRPGPASASMGRAPPRRQNASVKVAIKAGVVSVATLERPRVLIEGRVNASDQGLPNVELRLTRASKAEAGAISEDTEIVDGLTHTDADGVYLLEAPATGPAVLRLYSQDGYPVISRDVELSVGVNRHDFDLGVGQIRVLITSADGEPEGPVTLEVWQADIRRLVRTGTLEPDQTEILVYGLQLGHYELSAFTEQGLATVERPQVELTKWQPNDDVELVLEKQRAVATVLDANGQPMPGLLVAIDQRQLMETGERPGEYSLLGASIGSELRVVPPLGYLPVCRMLERIESMEIILHPAGAHALLIPPPGPLPPAGAFLGALENLPGSNCAMPVSLLWRSVEDAAGRQLVRLDGLTQGTFLFRNSDGVVIVQVPGPPVPMPGVE